MNMETFTVGDPIERSAVEECAKNPAASAHCICCNAESAKYKCPKCFLKYCSAGCCQAHKTNGTCLGTVSQSITSKLTTSQLSAGRRKVGGTEDPDDPYQRLLQLLKSPSLRDWIKKLDDSNAKDVPYLYETAMDNPEFVEYAQLIAKLRQSDHESDSSED